MQLKIRCRRRRAAALACPALVAVSCMFAMAAWSADPAEQENVARAAGDAATQTTAEVAEKAAELAVEKAAEDAAARDELKVRRPEEWLGPTRVFFNIFVLDIDSIDDANQSFMANVFVKLEWRDRRLASPQGVVRQIRLEEVWNPQVILANRQGLVSRSLPEVVQVTADGTVTYRQRYSGTLSQRLNLVRFPMDEHAFTIHFSSVAYGPGEIEFLPGRLGSSTEQSGGGMAHELSLPDWQITGYDISAKPYEPVQEVRTAGFALRFEARRYAVYYLWQVVLPLSVVVVMSWAGFWIQRDQVGVRVGIATSSILTLIAHRFVLASLLPRLPYMTRMDYFAVGSTLLVFLALLGVVGGSYLTRLDRDHMASKLDASARIAFPVAFVLLVTWFLAA